MLFGALTKVALRKTFVSFSAAAAAFLLPAFATPAMANSAADAFQMHGDYEQDVTPLGEADSEFRDLYSEWGFGISADAVAPSRSVAVPSLYPVDMTNVRRSSGFGARKAPLAGASTNHKGIDLAAPIGTPIYATADGTISRSGWASGYGKLVIINHGNGIESRYAHMSARSVNDGEAVKKGDIIGYVGSTGNSTGPHLHYEVRVEGVAINPVSFMIENPGEAPVRVAAK